MCRLNCVLFFFLFNTIQGGDPSVHDPRLIYYGIYDWHIEGLVDSNAATMCNGKELRHCFYF